VLVIHGTEDRILPFDSTAARLPDLIDEVMVVPVEGGPHNIGWTHPEIVNPVLLAFLEGGLDAVDEARSKVASA
jgi:non-heme chloroperoxidase